MNITKATHLEIYEFSTRVAYSVKSRWRAHMSDLDAISAAYFGILSVYRGQPIGAMYLRARGAIFNEIYWLMSGRKHGGHGWQEQLDDEIGYSDEAFEKIEWDSELRLAFEMLGKIRPQRAEILLSHAMGESSTDIAKRLGQKPSSVSAALGIAHREIRLLREGKKLMRVRKNGKRVLVEVPLGAERKTQ